MNQKLLKFSMDIAVSTSIYDEFQDATYVTITDDEKGWMFQAGQHAKNAEDCMQKLFWESVCCAMAHREAILTAKVCIEIDCAEFSGGLNCKLLKEEGNHYKWTPKLNEDVEKIMKQLRNEISDMLYRLAHAYYNGAAIEEVGEHHVIYLRY